MRAMYWPACAIVVLAGCGPVASEGDREPTSNIEFREPPLPSLEPFVDRDLRELTDEEREKLQPILAQLPGRDDSPFGAQPWHLWRSDAADGSAGFILFEGCPLFSIPGSSSAEIHVLSPQGKILGSSAFSTGWRINLKSAAMKHEPILDSTIIEVNTGPTINGADVARQIYAVIDKRIGLLRIEDAAGALVVNNYHNPNHTIGPPPPARTAKEWEQALESEDSATVLEALTWIGGIHRRDPSPPPANAHVEGVEPVRLVAELRGREGVQQAVAKLAESEVLWIREAAEAALKEFSR